MWPARLSARSSAAERSRGTTSRQGRASCCSRSRIVPTRLASRSRLRRLWRLILACLDSAFVSRSRCSSISDSSRSSSLEVRGDRLDIGSRSRRTYGQLCNPYLGRLTGNYRACNRIAATGNPVATKVVTTHVLRSAVAVRALPGARRSLRSLCVIRMSSLTSSSIGRLAGRCPSGEEAQSDEALGARQRGTGRVPAWSLLRRLPAPLADDGEQEDARSPLPAGCHRDGREPWRRPRRVQYARGAVS